jgi:hypothetical protein
MFVELRIISKRILNKLWHVNWIKVAKDRVQRCTIDNNLLYVATRVTHRPLTAEVWVRARVSPCMMCGGQSVTGTDFSPSSSIFPCQHQSTGAPYA